MRRQATLSGLSNAINVFEASLPTLFVKAFLAVAKDPGRTVSGYANSNGIAQQLGICGAGCAADRNGVMMPHRRTRFNLVKTSHNASKLRGLLLVHGPDGDCR